MLVGPRVTASVRLDLRRARKQLLAQRVWATFARHCSRPTPLSPSASNSTWVRLPGLRKERAGARVLRCTRTPLLVLSSRTYTSTIHPQNPGVVLNTLKTRVL